MECEEGDVREREGERSVRERCEGEGVECEERDVREREGEWSMRREM